MNIGRKLVGGFAVLLGLLGLLSTGGLIAVRTLHRDLEFAVKVIASEQHLAGEVHADTPEMANCSRAGVLAAVVSDTQQAAEYSKRFRTLAAALEDSLRQLRKLATTSAEASALQKLEDAAAAARQAHDEMSQAISSQRMDAGLNIFSQKVAPLLEDIGRQAASLVARHGQELSATTERLEANSARTRNASLALICIAFLAAAGVFSVVRQGSMALKRIASRAGDSADRVSQASAQVLASSRSLTGGASAHAQSLQHTTDSVQQIASIAHNNADNAAKVAVVMSESESVTTQVNQALDSMVDQMREINTSSTKIADVIKVIDEIAFQTNILALNAAVEAARAGDAGLGFAVVAAEVRNLALRSAESARNTSQMIEESIRNSRAGSTLLDQMAGAVRTMTGNSMRIKSLVDEVSQGSQEQTRGMDQISDAVRQMQQVLQNTMANAHEGADAGVALSEHAEGLRHLVHELRTMVGAR